jgi:hypothetical protein
MDQRLEQEADILFVRHTADEQRHRPRRVDAVALAESACRPPSANVERNAGGQDVHRRRHAVGRGAVRMARRRHDTASSALHWRREKRRACPRSQPAGKSGA